MTVGRLEARSTLAEIDLAGDPGFDHPLQRPIDGRPPDPGSLTADEIEQVVRAQMTFLLEEGLENPVALSWNACRPRGADGMGRERRDPLAVKPQGVRALWLDGWV